MSSLTSPAQTTQFFQAIRQKSDKIMDLALIICFLNGLFLSFFYDTWLIGISVGGLCLLAYYVTKRALPQSSLYQYVASSALAVFMAQFIYQMHGMFEMHFWAYVAATLLITYQNWKLYIPLSLIIVIHHGGFAYLQYSGLEEIYFTQLDYMDLRTFSFHAALALLIVAICAYWAYELARQTVISGSNQLKLEKQLEYMQQNIHFAEEISKGNLHIAFQANEEENELGSALLNMQQSLLEASEREKQDKFDNLGLTRLSDILRNYGHKLDELADKVLQEIVKYLNLNQGGLFLLEEQEERKVLTLTACYAYNKKKYLQKTIEIGEGLVGQTYLEREYIYMTDVPQGYTSITSGLGEATARSILLMPLIHNEEIVGILEVASLGTIPQTHIGFLQQAAQSIASTILSARINARTTDLLLQAQEQAEALGAQEEEMRQNLEEMQATQEEIQRRTASYEQTIAEKDAEIEALKRQLQSS